MRQVIPFGKEIVFKTNIASITSISLEHEEKVFDGEISGDFVIFGDYKIHNDTTEKELFKYRLPFTALIPENIKKETIKIDIQDFTYEQVEDDVLKVNIDFSIEGEEMEVVEEKRCEAEEELDLPFEPQVVEDEETPEKVEILEKPEFVMPIPDLENRDIDKEIDELLRLNREEMEEVKQLDKETQETKESNSDEETVRNDKGETVMETKETITEEKSEYVTYHIHIVKESETLEQIMNLYETNLDNIKLYNDIEKIKMGDKLIIPEYIDE